MSYLQAEAISKTIHLESAEEASQLLGPQDCFFKGN